MQKTIRKSRVRPTRIMKSIGSSRVSIICRAASLILERKSLIKLKIAKKTNKARRVHRSSTVSIKGLQTLVTINQNRNHLLALTTTKISRRRNSDSIHKKSMLNS
jgi:hypothetical protein